MSITTLNITQEEPVHFRITGIQPNPIAPHSRSNEIVLSVSYVNKPGGIHFGMSTEHYLPYRDILTEAIDSQAVYWVDWDYSKTPSWPPRMNDSTLDRLLRAVESRQFVALDSAIDEP